LASLSVVAVLALPLAAQEIKTETIEIPGTNPPLKIVFTQCPGGKVKLGDPSVAQNEVDVLPFSISQTEFTFGQLRTLLGQQAVDRLKAQMNAFPLVKELIEDEYHKAIFLPGKGDDFPVLCLSMDDVLAICKELDKRTMDPAKRIELAGKNPLDAVETNEFRVPTFAQWQYACRGPKPLEYPHFGSWVDLNTLKDANVLKQRWKEMGFNDEFTGTQDQLLRIARLPKDHVKRDDGDKFILQYMTAVLKPVQGTGRTEQELGAKLAPVGKSQPNTWGLFEMHDNVSEWVLWVNTTDEYNRTWQELLAKGAVSLKGKNKVYLAGANISEILVGENSLHKFTSWGGPKMQGNSAKPEALDYIDDKSDNDLRSFNPGLRLVIVTGLADDWFYMFRKAWIRDGKPVDAAQQTMIVDRVSKVFDTQSLPADHVARMTLNFYKLLGTDEAAALAEMKKAQALKPDPTTKEDDDAYLDTLSTLVESGKKKP